MAATTSTDVRPWLITERSNGLLVIYNHAGEAVCSTLSHQLAMRISQLPILEAMEQQRKEEATRWQ